MTLTNSDKKRKYNIYLITLVIVALLTLAKGLTGEHFVAMMQTAFWAFIVGNGVEHVAPAVNGMFKGKEEPK